MPDPIFCTPEEVKAQFRLAGGVVSFDTMIAGLVPSVTRVIQSYTRRSWIKKAHTEYFTTPQPQDARMPKWFLKERNVDFSVEPVVTYDEYGVHGEDVSALTLGTNFFLTEDEPGFKSPQLLLNIWTQYAERGCKIVYTAGYAMHSGTGVVSVPSHVKQACITQVLFLIRRASQGGSGKDSETQNNKDTVKYGKDANDDLVAEARNLLGGGDRRTLVGNT